MTNFFGDDEGTDPTARGVYAGGWTPEAASARMQLLKGNGFQWLSGEAQNALYRGPDGELYSEPDALTLISKLSTRLPSQADGGLTYEQQLAIKNTPSRSISQSYRDPADLQLDRDALNEKIRASIAQDAKDEQSLQLARDKARVEEEQGNKRLAIDSLALAESIAARVEKNRIDRQAMQNEMTALDRRIAADAAAQASRQAFDAEQSEADRALRAGEGAADRATQLYRDDLARESRETLAAREDQRQRATTAANFAAGGATDFGKLSSFLGNGGMSSLSTAIGQGQSAITDQSLQPLEGLLEPAQQVRKAGTLASYLAMFPQQAPKAKQQVQAPPLSQADAQAIANQNVGATDGDFNQAAFNAAIQAKISPPKMQDGGAVVDGKTLSELMQLVQQLGMTPKAIAGERGKPNGETVYSNGDVVIMPDKGKGALPKMEFGGGVISTALQRARDYQATAGRTAVERSGFGRVRGPVEFSDPGTDPELQRLGASVAAVGRGIPVNSYLNELMKLTPAGMNRGVNRRVY